MIPASDEGYWRGGKFTFEVVVPEEYNNKVDYNVQRSCDNQVIVML